MKKELENVKIKKPLIHSITNYVTVNDVANVILAVGASPIMADDEKEVEEITALCDGLNINIGTLNERTINSMIKAGKKANQLNHPVLLDPVGVGTSSLRTHTALKLLEEIHFTVIKGNISEMKTLAAHQGYTHGVDASENDMITVNNLEENIQFIKAYAKKMNTIIVVTGAIDLVSDGNQCYVISNGEKEMSHITGTGCQLSGLITSYISSNENKLKACVAAVCQMGLAGEIAKKHLADYEGNATYRNRIIDAIYCMNGEELEGGSHYEIK